MTPLDLPESYKLACAIIIGMIFGFVLVKSGLADPKSVREALQLRNGRVIKTFLLSLGLGTVIFYAARHAGMAEVHVRPSYIWGAVFGGIFCGCGLVMCALTPLSALAALATGKFFVLWVLVGMILVYPLVHCVADVLSLAVYIRSSAAPAPAEPSEFFALSSPAFYTAAAMLILLLLVHFTVGDNEE